MEMVGPADISNAVTLNSVVVNAARAVGPAIGGVMIATVGDRHVLRRSTPCPTSPSCRPPADPYATSSTLPPRSVRSAASTPRRVPLRVGTSRSATTLVMLVLIGTLTYEFSTTLPLFAEFTFDRVRSGSPS